MFNICIYKLEWLLLVASTFIRCYELTRRCSTGTGNLDIRLDKAPDSRSYRTTRRHLSPTGNDHLTKKKDAFTVRHNYTHHVINRQHVYTKRNKHRTLTYHPVPLSCIIELLTEYQEINDVRHVMVSETKIDMSR